jgi:hydrogenase maturation protein HypF
MEEPVSRRAILVRGVVQGVGFRPFVANLAAKYGIGGFVLNRMDGLYMEIQGPVLLLDKFLQELGTSPPPLAKVHSIEARACLPGESQSGFRICSSDLAGDTASCIPSDVATCDQCLIELFDSKDRRYNYPFINCTNCGPRFTIITALPYDRDRTTMARFTMCPECRAEYENPLDRRFHAEPIACPICGPRLQLLDAQGKPVVTADPIAFAADFLRAGNIVALKGLGGFHLACDATNESAVRELRRRKLRDGKPFAMMVPDIMTAKKLCDFNTEEQRILLSSEKPIVLIGKKVETVVAPSAAPGNAHLGVMLPYTPLHHLLMRRMEGVPLVMTSGNRSDEPMVFRDENALLALSGIADLFVTNDRPIAFRCDDSVMQMVGELPILVRRSRGYAPASLALPMTCTHPILAVGGQLKSTFALGRKDHAILSHHLGDLDAPAAWDGFQRSIAHYEQLFQFVPDVFAHDLHPDYASTRYAMDRSGKLPRVAVQHHHAHMASCMAEHGLTKPVIGVTFDGTGYGTDGTVWGGEFLIGDLCGYERAAHLRRVPMPGGERAIREPWRMALAYLIDAGLDSKVSLLKVPAQIAAHVQLAMRKGINAPLTSSAGRFLDAVAALVGLHSNVTFEGQAAISLESLALRATKSGSYPFVVEETLPVTVDMRPTIRAVCEAIERRDAPCEIARCVHCTLAEIITAVCEHLHHRTAIQDVVLSGGVFVNRILLSETSDRLARRSLKVFTHRLVPPNDGGLALGQLAVAAAQLQ